jgi:hypothetical protein
MRRHGRDDIGVMNLPTPEGIAVASARVRAFPQICCRVITAIYSLSADGEWFAGGQA